ncbi:hypothetical protein EYV94_00990 [Puteibacter caeruleilacunae]|nr:hypothetical protein EYV94_00990 [Puteibacter caeruleilacunae]
MIFNGINNQSVEFKVVNYQFPALRDKDYDGNWLTIYLNVKSEFGDWQVTDPLLLTWEIEDLIEWLMILSRNEKPEYLHQEFIEPNLSFHLLSDSNNAIKEIKILFQLECVPKNVDGDKEYFVIFEANNEELKRIAEDLEKELEKYPIKR